jgi:pSer/pThr/pTyr-binding forkhead associated (FHA) protein
MKVELVGVAKSESIVLNSLPAVIGPDEAANVERDESPAGGYNCLISQVDDQLVVWDLGSRGGTFVNGRRVTKAMLKASDTLRLGGTEFSVRCQPGPSRYLYGPRN